MRDRFLIGLRRTKCSCPRDKCPVTVDAFVESAAELEKLLKLYPHMEVIRDSRVKRVVAPRKPRGKPEHTEETI